MEVGGEKGKKRGRRKYIGKGEEKGEVGFFRSSVSPAKNLAEREGKGRGEGKEIKTRGGEKGEKKRRVPVFLLSALIRSGAKGGEKRKRGGGEEEISLEGEGERISGNGAVLLLSCSLLYLSLHPGKRGRKKKKKKGRREKTSEGRKGKERLIFLARILRPVATQCCEGKRRIRTLLKRGGGK